MSEIPATPIVPAKPVYPYDDEYMIFDKTTGHYVLTEKYVIEQLGIDLSSRINERNAINPSALVARFLKQASNMVYNYIHEFNTANCLQDLLIAKIPSFNHGGYGRTVLLPFHGRRRVSFDGQRKTCNVYRQKLRGGTASNRA